MICEEDVREAFSLTIFTDKRGCRFDELPNSPRESQNAAGFLLFIGNGCINPSIKPHIYCNVRVSVSFDTEGFTLSLTGCTVVYMGLFPYVH